MAYGRRPRLGRLDLSILGASPEKLAARQQEIPAVDIPALTDEQQQRLYVLNYRRQFGPGISSIEELERQRLIRTRRGK